MQSISFNSLQANLREIYAALHTQQGTDALNLFATSSSTVVFQGCWPGQAVKIWNRAWRFIQPSSFSVEDSLKLILTTLFDQAVHHAYDIRQKRIWGNMCQIDQIWKKNLTPQHDIKQRKRYTHFLKEELNGSIEAASPIYLADFDQRSRQVQSVQEIKIRRHTIVNFHQATYLFWSLFVKDKKKYAVLRQPLMHLIKFSSALNDRILFKALKKEGRWAQIEGILQQAIPVALIAKLDDTQSLTINERRSLTLWVQGLNRCQDTISPKMFSRILDEIMLIIHLQGSSHLTLPHLLEWLDQQGCQLIHRQDPAHMDWREKLKFGEEIECNDKKMILGHQISPNKFKDHFKIFELQEYPDYVVKMAHNRFLLLLEDKKSQDEQEHWGVRLVKTIAELEDAKGSAISGLDLQGRCVILEKLSAPLDSHAWISQELELAEEDEKIAHVFANHLFCMSQWRATPQNLSLTHLMWDKEGVLKSTRLLKKGQENYNDWEAYCEAAAKGNLYVLNFLMNVSKLSEHKVGLYYREAVKSVLETGKTDLIGRPLPLGHRQDIYNQHVKKICVKAQEMLQNCFEMMIAHLRKKNQYSYKQEGQLKKSVSAKFIQFYQFLPTPGRFPKDFEERVIKSFAKNASEDSLMPDSANAQDYYQEMHSLMMNCNQACLSNDDPDVTKE